MDFGLARELPSTSNNGTIYHPTMEDEKKEQGQQQQVMPSTSKNSKNNMLFNMTGTVGTMRYMSPEICLNQLYGLEADIYSWSIVSYEILTKTRPYDDMTPDLYHTLVCQQGIRPVCSNSGSGQEELLSAEYRLLLTNAWRTDPFKRLSLNRIQCQLDLFIQKEQLFLEAQELLESMPLNNNNNNNNNNNQALIMLSQSFSHNNILSKPCGGGGGGGGSKRRYNEADSNNTLNYNANNVNANANAIFPSASYHQHRHQHYHHDNVMHAARKIIPNHPIPNFGENGTNYHQQQQQRQQEQHYTMSPDRYYFQQQQQQQQQQQHPSSSIRAPVNVSLPLITPAEAFTMYSNSNSNSTNSNNNNNNIDTSFLSMRYGNGNNGISGGFYNNSNSSNNNNSSTKF
jgi:hypothetical protein